MNNQFDTTAKYDSKATNWMSDEIERLVEVWSQPEIQQEMETTYRNFFVFGKISKILLRYNVQRTASQCRVKIKNLKSTYTKLKETAPHEFEKLKCRHPYYETIENIMTQKLDDVDKLPIPRTDSRSSGLIKIESNLDDDNDDDDDEDDVNDVQFDIVNIHSHHGDDEEHSNFSMNQTHNSMMYESESSAIKNHTGPKAISKKRKLSYIEAEEPTDNNINHLNTECVKLILKKMDKMQNILLDSVKDIKQQMSEERKFYMECEERRLKFFAELEEKRRRDERDHELRLFRLFTSTIQNNSNGSNATASNSSAERSNPFYNTLINNNNQNTDDNELKK
ncbi:putative mediator of RNA polymerase II transcription subunit 12 isoform X5 [Patella vulgata]|uniref:putative mediator of RNA polymerase II transcription subunit 12 isoform X5 n=1 Tax=Patella vulgata TaxID=6465 RepID=UPI002180063D|nr:putative mediator of RNA polymerase II transcription subunit 12 isoform X5 [Patella vulgata]